MAKIFNFQGKRPFITPRLLPIGYAQTAENVKLGSGAMKGFKTLGSALGGVSAGDTIFKLGSTFLSWSSRRWVEKAAISGTDKVLVSDGSTYPKTMTAGSVTRRWGVIPPTEDAALEVSFHGTAEDGAPVVDTVSYVYTLVTADGEESDISSPTAFFDVQEGQYVGLTNWCVHTGNDSLSGAWYSATGNLITHIRVYRLNSDAAGNAEYQRVFLRASSGGAQVSEIPVVSISSAADVWYDAGTGADQLSQNLGAMLVTEGWDPPPTGMKGACMFANGMYAGFKDNIVYLSMPGYYYAFPASGTMDYTMELAYDVVAFAGFDETLVVGTTGYPEVISGTDPAFMTRNPLPFQQPCLSGKGIVSLPDGVAYVCPDGLFFISSEGGGVLTENIIDRDDWQTLALSSAMLAYHDGKIFIFFEDRSYGLIYDRALDYLVDITLTGITVRDVFVDPVADIMYLSTNYGVQAWEGGSSRLSADWKSGIIETPPVNFAAARVDGAFPAGSSTSFKLYVDNVLKHTQTISGDDPFRLPSGFRGRDHEILMEFSGSTIHSIHLGFSMEALANV